MRARRRLLFGLILACLMPPLSGCGGVLASDSTPIGKHLHIYSSLPLSGVLGPQAQQVLDGERLALVDAHRRVGRFRIDLISLDDTGGKREWEPGATAANARIADRDPRTIAYIGDLNSGASAISLPVNNLAGILQISPASPYVGLTSSFEAGQGDPERFYPSGHRSFVRLAPGDVVQAAAQVALMRQLHIHTLYMLTTGEPFRTPLAAIVASDAKLAGIELVGEQSVELAGAEVAAKFTSQVEQVRSSGAQAVFVDGNAGPGAIALWRQLHQADPRLALLGTGSMATSAFTAGIGAAARQTFLTTPMLSPASYPASSAHVLAGVRQRFHVPAGQVAAGPYALYGYEAMELVLSAIRRAGRHGDDRHAVVDAAFGIKRRESVLGRYSVLSDGETTLTGYGIDRVAHGRPIFWRQMRIGDGAPYYQHVP